MKFSLLLVLSFCSITILTAQKRYEQKALSEANQMAVSYNQRNYSQYVEYLLPSEYNNDTANKKGLAKIFTQSKDTGKLEIIKLLKLLTIRGEQQAIFLHYFHQKDGYIIGIANKKDKQWHFSQPLSRDAQFDLALTIAPSLDTGFALLVDPKYGKRIRFNLHESIPAFHFTDIKGNVLSSDDLNGKVLVINFWSIACGPCIKEIPQLSKLSESSKVLSQKNGFKIELVVLG